MSDEKKSKAKSGDVVSRLTDPSKYTGSHAHRFDATGKGRGLAGRVDLVNYTGSTNAKAINDTPAGAPLSMVPSQSSAAMSTSSAAAKSTTSPTGSPRKPVVHGKMGVTKFGTQAEKAAVITLFRNGDKNDAGVQLTVGKQYKTLEQLLDKASQSVKLPTGAVRKIYKKGGKVSVKKLEDFVDGGKYLCCGGEKPAPEDQLPKGFLE